MSEATRSIPVEYHSPRGLILGMCFVWGVGVGFAVNFFRAAEPVDQPEPARTEQVAAAEKTAPTDLERRRQDIPDVAEVAPAPVLAPSSRQTIEDVAVAPPPVILTTEGGLTGKTATLRSMAREGGPPPAGLDAGPAAAPPPIPDLNP